MMAFRILGRGLFASLAFFVAAGLGLPVQAGPREQARRMHDRLVGIPPSTSVLDAMALRIETGQPLVAADLAMQNPVFWRTALVNFVTPWTNVEQTVFGELNDYTATVIGLIRDDEDFRKVLSEDVVYVGAPGVVDAPYSHTDNEHYRQLESARVDLGDPDLLVPVTQSGLAGSQLGPGDAAGVITTRAAGEAFFSAGTNRRMWRFLAIHHLCRDMEQLKDNTRPADRIRQDVSRSPGGDSSIFHNDCSGCHSGMDPMAGAFAYFEWDAEQERVVHTSGQVQPKHLINDNTFPAGYVTTDNRWDNYWRSGPNAVLGWQGLNAGGYGPKSLGEEVANSRAFAECQVQKAFEHVCFRPAATTQDHDAVQAIATTFEGEGYSMRRVFAEVATYCMGD